MVYVGGAEPDAAGVGGGEDRGAVGVVGGGVVVGVGEEGEAEGVVFDAVVDCRAVREGYC